MEKLVLNKNRGWRGLAEAHYLDNDNNTIQKMIFSFSQPVWDDMLKGYLVMQDKDTYMVLKFNNTGSLPKGQRSVLLKNFIAEVLDIKTYPKKDWTQLALDSGQYGLISNFIQNNNRHTKSDWNCIGIRVTPMI